MTSMNLRAGLIAVLAFAVAAPVALFDPASAAAQSSKSQGAAQTQQGKKPATSCDGMDKKTKAYSDCVTTQAQTTKDVKKGGAASPGKAKKVN